VGILGILHFFAIKLGKVVVMPFHLVFKSDHDFIVSSRILSIPTAIKPVHNLYGQVQAGLVCSVAELG